MPENLGKSILVPAVFLLFSGSHFAAAGQQAAATSATPAPAAASLTLSVATVVKPRDGHNPTVAVDRRSGAVYLAWAQETPSATGDEAGSTVLLARSDDGGRHFGTPVVVNTPRDHVTSSVVTPPRVAVGLKGEVYVLYRHRDPDYKRGHWQLGRAVLRLAVSRDGGKTFAASIDAGSEEVEGVATSTELLNLFVAPQGDLYASYLDYRQSVAYALTHEGTPPRGQAPATQLRVARSTDGGRSFAKSVLVTEPTCACCGTQLAQGASGPLYASTRGAWLELKGSMDEVRDVFIATSRDQGQSWSSPVKIHNDGFKVSGCPDVTSGLVVDARGRLHAAWYTGTERHPGVFYAHSDDEGRTFSEPVQLLGGDWIPYSHVKLAVDGEGNAWVAFADRRGEEDAIQIARVSPDGAVLRSQSWRGIAPDVAALGQGVIITWSTQAPEGQDAGGGEISTAIVRVARGPGKL